MVRGLCNAGSELSRLLAGLSIESAPCRHRAIQCQAVWEQLAAAAAAATRMININAITSLQDIDLTADNDNEQCDINQVTYDFQSNSSTSQLWFPYTVMSQELQWLSLNSISSGLNNVDWYSFNHEWSKWHILKLNFLTYSQVAMIWLFFSFFLRVPAKTCK